MKKAFIFRITNHSGKKEYKRTKCSNYWSQDISVCWLFSVSGAKRIIDSLNSHNHSHYYSYGLEIIENY